MVDPTGEFPWLLLGLFVAGSGIDLGFQMGIEGRSFDEVNWLRVGVAGGTTAIGGVFGKALHSASIGGRTAFAAGAIADFGVGVAADRYLLGDGWGTAVASNMIGFGFGEFVGYAGKGITRSVINSGMGQFFNRSSRIGVVDPSVGMGTREWDFGESVPTDRIPNQTQPYSCVSACSVALLRQEGIEITEAQLMKKANLTGDSEIGFDRIVPTLNDLLDASSEFQFREISIDPADLAGLVNRGRLVAVNLNHHSVIVDRIDLKAGTVTILDPWGEGFNTGTAFETTLPMSRFEQLHFRGQFRAMVALRKSKG